MSQQPHKLKLSDQEEVAAFYRYAASLPYAFIREPESQERFLDIMEHKVRIARDEQEGRFIDFMQRARDSFELAVPYCRIAQSLVDLHTEGNQNIYQRALSVLTEWAAFIDLCFIQSRPPERCIELSPEEVFETSIAVASEGLTTQVLEVSYYRDRDREKALKGLESGNKPAEKQDLPVNDKRPADKPKGAKYPTPLQ